MKKDNQLLERVQKNLLTQTNITDYSKIPLIQGSLIVCGYSSKNEVGIGDKEYICIAEYQGGNLEYGIHLTNELVLSHISYENINIQKAPYIGEKDECCADAVSFWRLPSTDEVQLYNKFITQNTSYFIEKIDEYINRYTDEESVDYKMLFETLEDLRFYLKIQKNEVE